MELLHKYRLTALSALILLSCLTIISCEEPLTLEEVADLTQSNTGPYIIQIEHLELIDSLRTESPLLQSEFNKLLTGADSLLNTSFKYVIDKPAVPPSGDPHDYMSLHRYSYPDSTGSYTIIKDGETNPEFFDYDKPKLEKLSAAVYTLSLAYYYTKNEKYAEKASQEIFNWFLNSETKMNPNMNFASIRPGVDEHSGAGIVGGLDFIDIIESASLLYGSPHWTPDRHHALKEWFFEFYQWFYYSYPVDAFYTSNVSTWMDVQRAIYLLFTEQEDKLNSLSHIQPVSQRMSDQFEMNGVLPQEASRGIAQHYVYFNLKAYMNLSLIRKNHFSDTGSDRDWPVLKNCATGNCQYGGLKAALDDISGLVLNKTKIANFPTDPEFNSCRYLEIFSPATIAFESMEYEAVIDQLMAEGCRNSNIHLTYPSTGKL